MLSQDFAKCAFSVKDNIALGRISRRMTEDDIEEALNDSGLLEKVRGFPDGSSTMLGRLFGDGVHLFEGEWQRLAMARLYFRKAPVLILDEPSSSLDPLAERRILRNFGKMIRTGISILVSHRFSTIQFADRVLVVADGTIAESGSHEELLRNGSLYEEMFNSQAGAYRILEE